ncbi:MULTISPECIES: cupin domain-containing protein [unclassified Ensifer]|uniref:cupin domain-containing protein n=1 Tax=unclassified Ensifer TaxID=2633371 RepID=UPI000813A974|nr:MULTISPECIES: cupin domain-containing protein [unclassified Ensifer]OCP00048.1 cupin [Ensifer sp. LC11]OCP00333.1 cupin [Ensifer sp. LC13]OCP04101.1 cupin [Ensifer sp. LC14]OCP30936.1 cupin [Ensifer sp. LC499]
MTGPLTERERAEAAINDRIGTELVHEGAGLRVWHLRLQPGETLGPHRHDRPYFWTALTDGTARARSGDGRTTDVIYRAGDTRHFSDLTPATAFVHDLTNTGDAELVFVTVEFAPEDHSPANRSKP